MKYLDRYAPIEQADTQWITDELLERKFTVGSMIPTFPSILRFPHPAVLRTSSNEPKAFRHHDGWAVFVPWSLVAAHLGQTMTGSTHYEDLFSQRINHEGYLPDVWDEPPSESVPPTSAYVLEILENLPNANRCACGFWDGYADVRDDPTPTAVLETKNGSFKLFARTLDGVIEDWRSISTFDLGVEQLPDVIWPDDRSWFLTTVYNGVSTYVACSTSAAEHLEKNTGHESYRVARDTPL